MLKVRTETVVTTTFELTLTQDQLDALTYVLRRVGGNPDDSPRAKTAEVLDAIEPYANVLPKNCTSSTGSIYFNN